MAVKVRQLWDGAEAALALVAPRMARRRQLARLAYEATAKRASLAFEGAGQGRRAADWLRRDPGPKTSSIELGTLRTRARDLRRNNPYARRAVDAIVSNAVGTGVRARVRDAQGNTHVALQQAWDRWSSSPNIDADGRGNFASLQRLALASVVESGEVFVRLRRRRGPDEGAEGLPIQLQLLEADYVDADEPLGYRVAAAGSNRIVQGIEVTKRGKRVAYYMHREHPAHSLTVGTEEAVRVPALDVAHLYRVDRPGQLRGVPWFAPVITRLRDLGSYEDAQLERQRVAALFAAFVNDETGNIDPAVAAASQAWEMPDDLEPGGLLELPPGRKVEFSDPPEATGYADYLRVSLHAIGVGVGVPYMMLTGDLSSANYSSSRMGRLEFQRSIREWQSDLVFPLCEQVFSWWLEAMALVTGVEVEGVRAQWLAPHVDSVDPQKETAAISDRIRNGLTSWPRAVRESGLDPEELLVELRESAQAFDDNGLVLDCDPRVQSKAGQAQVGPGAAANDAEAETDQAETEAEDEDTEGEESAT